jgi:hypothetical protein
MVGNKTHEQQLRIFEGRENSKNADKDFDPSLDLHKSAEERERERQSQNLKPHPEIQDDDRSMIRGTNQESRQHKG